MSEVAESRKVVIIGGGPGGYPAAFRAADMGMDVTLVEMEENPGGVCLYRGCIPSKALLHVAKVVNESGELLEMGVKFTEPVFDFPKMKAWKDSVVHRLTGGLGQLAKVKNVNYVRGRAKFTSGTSVTVDLNDGGTQDLDFDYAILAAGSRPATIPFFPEDPRVLDSTTALDISERPNSLLVVGGGYIGLELGTVYATLGTKVYVVEMMKDLLPGADQDLVRPLAARLKNLFSGIMTDTKVTGVEAVSEGINVRFEGKNAIEPEMTFDKVLVSVGRKPNSEDLGLENTRVVVNDRGFIEIDPQRRTAEPTIFAIGDVAGDPMLAHKATHEGIVAAEAIAGKKTIFDPRSIPCVVFTDPEIAWTGITEIEAKEQGLNVTVAKFPWAASGRATTLERNDGVTKIIVDAETQLVLGIGITGVGAGDMIAEGALAIEMGANVEDLALTIHPHPTLSETVMEAAEVFFGHSAHFASKK
jgi:dihydrolipoamide dehydrogenase